MNPAGIAGALNYYEDGITPYMLFFKDGVVSEKFVSTVVPAVDSKLSGWCLNVNTHSSLVTVTTFQMAPQPDHELQISSPINVYSLGYEAQLLVIIE